MMKKCRQKVHNDITLTATKIAESADQTATVTITKMYDPTINNDSLAKEMKSVLERASDKKVTEALLQGASEDFSFYAKEVPGLFVFMGITPKDQDPADSCTKSQS